MMITDQTNLILCCGMSRSGSTVQYQIVKHLLPGWQGYGFPVFWANQPYAILKAEVYQPELGDLLDSGRAIGLSTFRDPRDVYGSLRGFYTRAAEFKGDPRPIDHQAVLRYTAKALKWYLQWTAHDNVVSIRYERYLPHHVDQFARAIASILGVPDPDKEEILSKFDIEQQSLSLDADPDEWLDKETMLTQGHLSPSLGASTWRDSLTVQEILHIQDLPGAMSLIARQRYPVLEVSL